jgi:hypothetical protein
MEIAWGAGCALELQPEVAFHCYQKPKEKMNTTIKLAIMAGTLGLAVQVNASLFDISFTSATGALSDYGASGLLAGNGTLTATDNGNGTWNVTAGTFDVTEGALGAMIGSYTLVANPNAPNSIINWTYGYEWDNQASYPTIPYVDNAGLLFSSSAGLLLNLFSDSPTVYAASAAGPPAYPWNYFNTVGTLTLTPVPEPTTLISGALLLLPFGASTLRILRRRVA